MGVRLLGHFLRGSASMRGIPKEQMEIIEIPLFETPLCLACCPVSGDLLVGCAKTLVLFTLRRQTLSDRLSVLDFERLLILHTKGWTPSQLSLCGGYVAMHSDLEVLVLQLEKPQFEMTQQQQSDGGDGEGHQEPRPNALLPQDMLSGDSGMNQSGWTY